MSRTQLLCPLVSWFHPRQRIGVGLAHPCGPGSAFLRAGSGVNDAGLHRVNNKDGSKHPAARNHRRSSALRMLRSNSPFGNDTSSYAGSIQSNGYSSTVDEVSSMVSNVSTPSAKSIYLQRKVYAVSVNRMMNRFQYKVEHLFTCDLDGRELRSVADCVERLKLLDGMGRVWGQNMLLEVRGVNLLLTDTDTKEELECIALSDVVELKAVLDAGIFNSLLTVSVQPGRRTTTVFMFQCEDVRADYVQKDLTQALSRRRENPSIYSSSGVTAAREGEKKYNAPNASEREVFLEPELRQEEEEEEEASPFQEEVPLPQLSSPEEGPPRPYTEVDRSVDILNHILSDIETFMGQVSAAVAKNGKKKKKKKGKGGAQWPDQ
ncbi:unnamed protein product [Pleuronectes platessa]|uniref:PTB domain-containing protein n=1 Tax=Pleuronectes platessa TaxID=8262 RepID=A0A9N7TSN7_PLEPL|nr:unnamed protein product [Pleuronectes platessa]